VPPTRSGSRARNGSQSIGVRPMPPAWKGPDTRVTFGVGNRGAENHQGDKTCPCNPQRREYDRFEEDLLDQGRRQAPAARVERARRFAIQRGGTGLGALRRGHRTGGRTSASGPRGSADNAGNGHKGRQPVDEVGPRYAIGRRFTARDPRGRSDAPTRVEPSEARGFRQLRFATDAPMEVQLSCSAKSRDALRCTQESRARRCH